MPPRQTRRPKPFLSSPPPGVGIDSYGSEAVDPTENVLALVDAQAKFQEKYDEQTAKYNAAEQAWIIKYFEGLASMKERFDKQISDTQTTQLKTTSDLVSATQTKMEGSLSTSINKAVENIAAQFNIMNERLAKVEQFRYETGGKDQRGSSSMALNFALVMAALGAGGIIVGVIEIFVRSH